jgi:hypothetical protein
VIRNYEIRNFVIRKFLIRNFEITKFVFVPCFCHCEKRQLYKADGTSINCMYKIVQCTCTFTISLQMGLLLHGESLRGNRRIKSPVCLDIISGASFVCLSLVLCTVHIVYTLGNIYISKTVIYVMAKSSVFLASNKVKGWSSVIGYSSNIVDIMAKFTLYVFYRCFRKLGIFAAIDHTLYSLCK